MATQAFLARVLGSTRQIFGLDKSAGAADAGKIIATGPDGKIDMSLMPTGIGANTTVAAATEAIGAGKFVNYHEAGGVLSVRLADNSNGRRADGYVREAATASSQATVYPLDSTNTTMTGLTPGKRYWLGIAGGVIDVPLLESDPANLNKVSQYIGVAKSATELVTDDDGFVIL